MDMPPGLESLVNYGALGVFMAFVLWALVKSCRYVSEQLFSRDPDRKGLVVLKVESSVMRDRKMGEFMDALSEREVKQQELCDRHNAGLITISTSLAEHHSSAGEMAKDIRRLKHAAREACEVAKVAATTTPIDQGRILSHLHEIERIVSETAREVG
jgi:hypothetical protein